MSHFQAFVFLVFLAFGTSQAWTPAPFRKYRVQAVNGLKNEVLHAHCKSGDKDLGPRELPVNGEFNWGFHINLWGTTLYFCNLGWSGGHRTFDAFKVDDKFVNNECWGKECVWKAQEDGVYIMHQHKDFQLKCPWEH